MKTLINNLEGECKIKKDVEELFDRSLDVWSNQGKVDRIWTELHYYGRYTLVARILGEPTKKDEILIIAGCGRGDPFFDDSGYSIIGFDLSIESCKDAKKKIGPRVIQCDMEYIPLKTSCADKITAIYSLVYVPNKLRALSEFERILRCRVQSVLS